MLSETSNADPAARSSHGEEAQTGDSADQISVNSAQVRCSVCSSTFRRPEHLKRHLRSHTKEKPFECNQCGRHFSRTDTLHRHELSHHAPGSEGGKDHTHRITVKTFRACFSCATARVRCSGGDPCGRCDTRSLICQYPTERRSKAKVNNEASQRLSGVAVNDIDEPLQMHAPALQQPGRFPVDGLCDPHPSPKTMMNTFSGLTEARSEDIPSDKRDSAGTINTQLPLGVYWNGDGHHPYSKIPNSMPRPFSEPMADVRTGTKSLQSDVATTRGDIDMGMVGSTSMSLEFDPLLFDQSMLSTINWLPGEFLADSRSEQSRSMQVSSQPPHSFLSDAYAPCTTWQPTVINADHATYSNVSQTPSGNHALGTDTASSRRSSHILNEISPYSDSVDSVKRSTDHYVDGGDARLPKHRKKHPSWSTSSADTATLTERPSSYDSAAHPLGFPVLHEIHMENISKELMRSIRPLEQSAYEEIYRNFLLLCRSDNPFFEMFNSEIFPSAEACTQFIASFFGSFDTVYPIFHLPTFDPNQCHWLVTLAVMAIGCHSSGTEKIDHFTEAFHEMIRRAIFVEKEKHGPSQTSLDLIQAMLLNCIGLLHSDCERAKLSALSSFRDVVMLMKRQKLLTPTRSITRTSDTANEVTWKEWIKGEARRRTGYCVWLLDCTIAYYFDDRPLLSLDDGHAPLPAAENLWHADSADTWMQLWRDSDVNESLYDAVHILYIEKRLVTGIDELSHILLIHALYHRMWEVGDYFHRPLSFWNPTAKKQSRETAIPTGSVWLPGIPSYSKWRNSACDCLDILHWTANSTIAKAAGLEHPTVLHLHVARLVLLTPFRKIRSLATSLATKNLRWNKRHQAIEWQYIWRWTKHDQFKARLSVIHAGVMLWHIRRYSTNAFYEPVAAFLAVLTLWAYGSCLSHSPQESSPHTQGSGAESHHEPRFVHLDRPCDDELVQLFVREGHRMRGNITGVGDICAAEGPERILRVGSEILSSLSAWGISKQFITVLNQLADIESQHSEIEQACSGDMES